MKLLSKEITILESINPITILEKLNPKTLEYLAKLTHDAQFEESVKVLLVQNGYSNGITIEVFVGKNFSIFV